MTHSDSIIAENVARAETRFGPAGCGYGTEGSGPQYEAWRELANYILEWFYDPDLEAIRMTYATICAHYAVPDKPAWFFLLGDSGTGKTTLAIEPCKSISRVNMLSDVTPKSFISGYKSNGKANVGLLQRGDASKSMIWLFQDFTSIVSLDQDTLLQVAKIFREVWDGATSKESASEGKVIWRGRVTAIAAGTPAVERHWQRFRHFGERFITYRWQSPKDFSAAAKWVLRQAPHRSQISKSLEERVFKIFDGTWLSGLTRNHLYTALPPELEQNLADSATLAALLQTPVERDKRDAIRHVGNAEFPSRLIAAVQYMLKGHMILMGKSVPSMAEHRIARRILLDSIPAYRRRILDAMPPDDFPLNRSQIQRLTGIPKASIYAEVEELAAIGVLDVSSGKEPAIAWSKSFLDLRKKATFLQKV